MKKICVICGRTFDSHYGSEVCSQNCFTIRKRINDENSNLRRKNHESNTPILKNVLFVVKILKVSGINIVQKNVLR